MTNKRLVWYLEKEKKIDDRQFGFRKQRSTIYAISKLTSEVLDKFRRKEKTTAIFFDIKKAYNKNNRNKTSEQIENLKIKKRIMEFIRELISNRWMKMRVGGYTSQNRQEELGIS